MSAVNHVLRPRPRRTTTNCAVCYGRGWHPAEEGDRVFPTRCAVDPEICDGAGLGGERLTAAVSLDLATWAVVRALRLHGPRDREHVALRAPLSCRCLGFGWVFEGDGPSPVFASCPECGAVAPEDLECRVWQDAVLFDHLEMRPDLSAEVWLWPLRGTTWDLFDTGHSVEIQKVDSPDVDGRTFETDDEAAGYVVMHAQWEENPNVLLRDQCRAVLDELVYSWGEDAD